MNHKEMVALIQNGVPGSGGTWADFGSGVGAFTRALRDLAGGEAVIYAIDADGHALAALRSMADFPHLHTLVADFTGPLTLPPLDGALMANALHWIKDHAATLTHIAGFVRPGGRLLVVEYDVPSPFSFIPYPLSFRRFETVAAEIGLREVRRVGERTSPSNGITMYAASARVGR